MKVCGLRCARMWECLRVGTAIDRIVACSSVSCCCFLPQFMARKRIAADAKRAEEERRKELEATHWVVDGAGAGAGSSKAPRSVERVVVAGGPAAS